MPNVKPPGKAMVKNLEGGEKTWEYNSKVDKIVCLCCNNGIDYSASNFLYRYNSHLTSAKRIKLVTLSRKRQHLLQFNETNPNENQKGNSFYGRTTEAFISANIPFEKLRNYKLIALLEEFTGQSVPEPSTLRKNYVPKIFNDIMIKIRDSLSGKDIYVMTVEATDGADRFMVGIFVGLLGCIVQTIFDRASRS